MVMTQINMTSIRSLVLFLALTTIHAQNVCSGGSANCMNISNCPQIMSILADPTPSEQMLQTLRNAQCGFESNDPKYCCNQVTTTMTTTVKTEIETLHPPDVTNHPNLRLLDHQVCGPIPQHRANGGNETVFFQYPWMAILAYEMIPTDDLSQFTGEIFSTGTIISSRYILVAAHSCDVKGFRVISVRVGDHDRTTERDCITDNKGVEIMCAEKYQDFDVDSIHIHPGFTKNTLQDDIALIRLNGSIDFRPRNVKPICLPFGTAAIITRKKAIASGWRMRHEILRQAKLSLVTNEWCKEMYKNVPDGIYSGNIKLYDIIVPEITYKVLCAGQGNEDVCMCEGGAPLQVTGIYNGGSVRIIQHGVGLFVQNCFQGEHPAVYTKVSFYMDWILNTMTD